MHVMRKYNAKPQRICMFFLMFQMNSEKKSNKKMEKGENADSQE